MTEEEKKAARREYRNRPEVKARAKAYDASPKRRAYDASPERKARLKAYNRSEKAKAANKVRESTPERKLVHKAYDTSHRGRTFKMLHHARHSGRECTITFEDIIIPEVCPVYGIKLDCAAEPKAPNLPSLDRVDNTKGYIPGNVRVISWKANRSKGDLSVEDLLSLAEYIIKHQAGEK